MKFASKAKARFAFALTLLCVGSAAQAGPAD